LLVPGVCADDMHDAAPPDHSATLTHRLHGRSYLHSQNLSAPCFSRSLWLHAKDMAQFPGRIFQKAHKPHESGE